MAKYDVDCFVHPPDPDFICCICQCVFADPKESPCRHVFCTICIETWLKNKQNCPTCRKKMGKENLKPVIPLIQNVLNRMEMKCTNREAGCTEIVQLANFDKHIEECLYGEVQCRFEKCQKKVLRRNIKTHEENCKFREIKCNKDCGLMILWTSRKTHNCCETLKEYVQEQKKIIEKLRERDRELRQLKDEMTQRLRDLERRRELETLRQELISAGPGFDTFDTASDLELTVADSDSDSVVLADNSTDLDLGIESDTDNDVPIVLDSSGDELDLSNGSSTETGQSENIDNGIASPSSESDNQSTYDTSSTDSVSDFSDEFTVTNRRRNRRALRSDSEASGDDSDRNGDDRESSMERRTEVRRNVTYEFNSSQNISENSDGIAQTRNISLNISVDVNSRAAESGSGDGPVRRCARLKRRRRYASSDSDSDDEDTERSRAKRLRSSLPQTENRSVRMEDQRLELVEEGYELRNGNRNNTHCDTPIKNRLRSSTRNASCSNGTSHSASHACTRMCNCGATFPSGRDGADTEQGNSSAGTEQGNSSQSGTTQDNTIVTNTWRSLIPVTIPVTRQSARQSTTNSCDNENNQVTPMDSDSDDTWEPANIDTPSDLSISDEDITENENYEVRVPRSFSEILALYLSDDEDDDDEWTPPT